MPYLKLKDEIRSLVAKLSKAKTLWLDTEVADYDTRNQQLL